MSVKDSETNSLAAVQVAVRIRPLSDKDRTQPRFAHAASDNVLQAHENNTVVISPPHNKIFTFDHVFGPQTQQAEIFAALGEKSIRKFVEGYNVTMLAYGQTSSGKTYTVGTAHHTGQFHPEQEGIVPRAMALLFDLLHQIDTRPTSPTTSLSASSSIDGTTSTKGRLRPVSRISYSSFNNNNNSSSSSSASTNSNNNAKSKYKYTVKVSFVEIYNEELIDLLNFAPPNERPPVTIREDTKGQIYWTGVKEMMVNNTDDVLMYLQQGTQNRATGATDMNEQSSRSHAIFSVTLRQEKWTPTATNNNNNSHTPRTASPTSPRSKPRPLSAMNLRMNDGLSSNDDAGEWIITTSKLHFVDLAGSERLKRTAAEGDRRKEGININGGLLALGNVISALGDASKKSTHIPYRDSKLTRLLQDSLGGSAMTLMIACVSPMEYNISETLNTLQYANRARNIKNRIEKNEVEEWLTTDNVDLLRSIITKLKSELRNRSTTQQQKGEGRLSVSPIPRHMYADGDQSFQEQHVALVADLKRQLEELSSETAITRERNCVVENQLKMMKAMTDRSSGDNKGGRTIPGKDYLDFEQYVEPVIKEYETSISTVESQLSMTRAALTHSDIRIDELQALTQMQDDMLNDLNVKINKFKEKEQHNQKYIEELEGKLLHSVNDAEQDEELLNELKNRIMKFKELDDSTELYILDLEKQLSTNEADYANKIQQHQQTITKQNDRIEQLEHDLRDLQLGHIQQTGNDDMGKQMEMINERQSLQQHIAKLEHDLMNVTSQLQQQQQNGGVNPSLVESDSVLEEHHRQQRLAISSPPPSSTMDPDHEKRKRMFSGGNPHRPTNSKSTLLQSTLASLDTVQSDYVALKERYKHWTVASQATLGEEDHPAPPPPPPQGLAPTMSTGSSSLSSLDSIGTGTGTVLSTTTTTAAKVSNNDHGQSTIQDIQTKCDHVVKQYQNQLERISGAIQRVTKLERTTSDTGLPISPTTPSPSPPPPSSTEAHDRDALLDLEQQLKDRQQALQEACTRFELEMKDDLATWQQNDPSHSEQHWMQRLSTALQDVELHRSKTFVLQTKLQKLEVAAFHAQQKRKSSASEDQDGIEQLMKKMDAIKIQLESRDVKSISVKE
ncbi:unnamed protein product [Absidia cylindrospora]